MIGNLQKMMSFLDIFTEEKLSPNNIRNRISVSIKQISFFYIACRVFFWMQKITMVKNISFISRIFSFYKEKNGT